MGFDRGGITCRICKLPQPLPKDALERFAALAAGPLEQVQDEPTWGWVTGRFLLDTEINADTCQYGSLLHLCLRQAERKVPSSLMNAECRLEEMVQRKVRKVEHLNRKAIREIKEEVRKRLLPKMPPTFSGIYVAIDTVTGFLYVSATSEKQLDLFTGFFAKAMGFDPIPMTPDALAQVLFGTDPSTVPAVNISPALEEEVGATGQLGENFLTWLWFFQESRQGVLPPTRLGEFSLLVDGPLTFVAQGSGSFESSLRKGTPTNSAEARSAMLVGKKLRTAKLVVARNKGEEWSCTLDASQLVFRGLKLPEGEAMDPADIFEERMANLDIFRELLFQLFRLYLETVKDPAKRQEYQKQAKQWVQDHAQF